MQFPNEPLIVALVAGQAAKHLHGLSHSYAIAVGYVGLAIWAFEELTQGVNWFRRLLGLVFIGITIMSLTKALHP